MQEAVGWEPRLGCVSCATCTVPPASRTLHPSPPQVIDVDGGTLQNVITFPPEGAFIVDSGISISGEQRTDFKFRSATLKLPKGRRLRLPPFGQGWCVGRGHGEGRAQRWGLVGCRCVPCAWDSLLLQQFSRPITPPLQV